MVNESEFRQGSSISERWTWQIQAREANEFHIIDLRGLWM